MLVWLQLFDDELARRDEDRPGLALRGRDLVLALVQQLVHEQPQVHAVHPPDVPASLVQ